MLRYRKATFPGKKKDKDTKKAVRPPLALPTCLSILASRCTSPPD